MASERNRGVTELLAVRRAYARQIMLASGVENPRLEVALAKLPREVEFDYQARGLFMGGQLRKIQSGEMDHSAGSLLEDVGDFPCSCFMVGILNDKGRYH